MNDDLKQLIISTFIFLIFLISIILFSHLKMK